MTCEDEESGEDESFDSSQIFFKDKSIQKDFERFCAHGVISSVDSELHKSLKHDNATSGAAEEHKHVRGQENQTLGKEESNETAARTDAASMRLRGGTRSRRPHAPVVRKDVQEKPSSIFSSLLQSLSGIRSFFTCGWNAAKRKGSGQTSTHGNGVETMDAQGQAETLRDEVPKAAGQGGTSYRSHKLKRLNSLILVGYLGTKFCGSQIQLKPRSTVKRRDQPSGEMPDDVSEDTGETDGTRGFAHPTVEQELMEVCHQAGLIAVLNPENPKQLCLSRASRTDKGVHAALNVISMKLQLNRSTGHDEADGVHVEVKAMTGSQYYLTPPASGARNICSLRTYEYLLPSCLLGAETADIDQKVDKLNSLLKKFSGNKFFINFCGRDSVSDSLFQTVPSQSNTSDENLDFWRAKKFPKRSIVDSKRVVYRCHAEPITLHFDDGNASASFVKIEICANSFMLHQIRKMIGTCLAVLHGSIPELYLDMPKALQGDYRLPCPLAPGSGLILTNMSLWDERKERFKAEVPEDVAEKSLEYKQRVVYPHVAAMFREGGRGDAEFKVFYGSLGRFSDAVLLHAGVNNMSRLLNYIHSQVQLSSSQVNDAHRWRGDREAASPTAKSRQDRASLIQNVLKQKVKASGAVYPKGTMNEICFQYGILPGPLLNEVRREIIRAVGIGLLPISNHDMAPFLQHARHYLETKGMTFVVNGDSV
ncbi:hypothetical protein GUITHDRAFT_134700 [Guillardia theta CCMP2712]|uniref:Pseudouridine synthase I TruA alpha/beta domain-containing protein n=1 Tax=Guillardia theta (strain CCMP2712) TaxID=905079 RepID=L1JRK1_GUITC|nr:hypothetical protein GUITHDRAFT_134700 [Guillardia theta CCMP2712]EKX51196.1 hypothetical protein GUITHDRAFT_134700 [Guillardia theta CCMP2712]|eukprot:XP_005838176.1 hypothetical protein GUITHDRAFT_134700 [Guillardia theta CCMP2712]